MAKVKLGKKGKSKWTKSKGSEFVLPTELSKPSMNLGEYTICIFGEGKVGKTSLISHFPNPYFLMFEISGKALSLLQSRIDSWPTFLACLDKLNENRNYCETVVMDTGYEAYDCCYQYMLEEFGVTNFKEAPYGFWKEVDKEFKSAHDRIVDMGFGLVVTAHCDEEEITKNGFTRHKTTLQLGKQATRYYKAAMDILAYYYIDGDGKRCLAIRGDESTLAGTRTEGRFLYTDGTDMMKIPMGKNSTEAYKNFIKAFNNGFINPDNKKGGKVKKKLSLK